MKIKMLVSFAGNWSCNANDIIEKPDIEAKNLIKAGFAVPIKDIRKENAALNKKGE